MIMKVLKYNLLMLMLLFMTVTYAQSHKVIEYAFEDGLMNQNVSGIFQDHYGILWVANASGFTRLIGDHYDHVNPDLKVWGAPIKVSENTAMYSNMKIVNGELIPITGEHLSSVDRVYGEFDIRMNFLVKPHIDEFGYFWSCYESEDSLRLIRYKEGDTTDINALLNNKFGIQFQHIYRAVSIFEDLIFPSTFIEDNKGNFWFNTTAKHLYKYDFNKFELDDYGEFSNVCEVKIDSEENTWVAILPSMENLNPGIYRIDDDKKVEHFSSVRGSEIFIDPLEKVYLLDEAGLKLFNGDGFELIPETENTRRLVFNSLGAVYVNKYVNDSTHIMYLKEGKLSHVKSFEGAVWGMFVDRENILWLWNGKSFHKCIPSAFSVRDKSELLHKSSIVSPLEEINLDNGMTFYTKNSSIDGKNVTKLLRTFEAQEHNIEIPASYSRIPGFATDQHGNLYLVVLDQDIRAGDYAYTTTFSDLLTLTPDLRLESIVDGELEKLKGKDLGANVGLRTYNDKVYFFCEKGVYRKNNSGFKYLDSDTSRFEDFYIAACNNVDFQLINGFERPDSTFTITDEWGNKYGRIRSLKFDLESETFSDFEGNNDSSLYTNVYGLNDGWISFSEKNMYIKVGAESKLVQYPSSKLDSNEVLTPHYTEPILLDDGSMIYWSKEQGLVYYNNKNELFIQKTVTDGLSSLGFHGMLIDPDSTSIWFSNVMTLQKIDIESVKSVGDLLIETWNIGDGYVPGKHMRFLNDSILEFQTSTQVITFNSRNRGTTTKPLIHFTDVYLLNDTLNWSNIESDFYISDGTKIPRNLDLSASENYLTFFFQGVSHLEEELWYEYKLEGLQEDWIRTNNKSVAYPDLDPGDYTFQARAVNAIGASEPISIKFYIAKPWYQTALARLSFALLTILAVLGFVRFRTAKLKKGKVILEKKVEDRTAEVVIQKQEAEHQRDIVEEKNREILDSITYAKRLQTAILPPQKLVKEWLNDSFIFYKPKDIVAGDFYWMETTKRNGRNIVFYAAADCTGHGVPGAMVSVVCSNALKRAIKEFNISDPGKLLDKVAEIVQESFEQSEHEVKDGMDIAVCAIDLIDRKVWFSGANNGLYRITSEDTKIPEGLKVMESGNRKLVEYSANKQPVGSYEHMVPFTTIEIQLEPGDCIYLFSDGFADQFGGERGKKFKYKPFKQLLLDIEEKEMDSQKDILDTEFERWKGNLEQVDDVCIIGLRVNGHMRKLFSKRELEVIQKIKDGRQSKEIAEELNLAKSTVDTYRKRILAKTNLGNAAELIKFCDEHEVL
jgi:serine phosphatase RsbU (regulator of sigma subunit)